MESGGCKKVLVTGATGFVGRQVCRALRQEPGVDLAVVVRPGKINQAVAAQVWVSEDLFREPVERWQQWCEGIDTLIHLAWYAEPGLYLQSPRNLDCLQGSLAMAQGAVAAGVRRLVGIGTCFEYDLSGGVLSVHTPLNPVTLYAAAKASTYLTLSQYCAQAGVEFAWCRLFYLYGEGEDPRRFVPYLRSQLAAGEPALLTSGRQIRDYLDVAVAGDYIVKAALGSVQGALNICSGIPITVRQLAEQIAQEYGRLDLLRFGARPENLVDPPCVVGLPHPPLDSP
jgi:dTDP-6-deoxy-L-talose 4-dehydrogenase (NAD+)